jgi:hypothetical protein
MLKSSETRLDALQAIIARREEELAIFLGLEPTRKNKIPEKPWFQGKEKENSGPEALEARFTGDDFFRNFIDHGMGAVFPYQTG